MIKLIVGLGNPGQQYQENRHNVGFLFLDYLLGRGEVSSSEKWHLEQKFNGLVVKSTIAGEKVILLKPQTYMNRSGLAVAGVSKYYKINVDEILVVHDELDLPAGALKLKFSGGHAGHNGLRDIISALGSNEFYRIRMGIGRPSSGKEIADYVLSNPAKSDLIVMHQKFDLLSEQLNHIVSGDISQSMNALNS